MRSGLPQLETARLLLRAPVLADFDRWAELSADAESTRYLGGVQPRAVAWRSFAAMVGMWRLTGIAMFSLIEKESGRWVGRLGPWRPEGWPGTEVGWSLHPDARGKGYATEGASAAIDYAFDVLGWTEVIHCIDPRNIASQQVARRLGSSLRGPVALPPPLAGEACEAWGQDRDAWRARRR